ncbi:MAG TPA: lysylphosphatidylglycerol synthase transmembrane domain-containing protein, partial [Dongiaceae bacterium]|nr:lysylphosphatidylglycerol synthase transmembrane domain-containing protein [Dongiaceae bacterium]
PVSLDSLYSATMIGFMANNLLPLRLGEFVRAWALGRRENLSKTTVFATVVVERVVDMITLLGIFGIALLLHPIASTTEAGRLTNVGAGILMAVCVGSTLVLVAIERSPALMRRFTEWVAGPLPERFRRKAVAAITHFAEGLSLFRDLPRLLWVFVLSFAMFGCFALCLQISMWALGIDVPWYGGLVMLVITAIGIMVPAAPGYIGTMNAACVAGLKLFSVGPDRAAPFSWFYWAGQWIPVTLVGFYYLRREGLSLKSLGEASDGAA